MIKNLLNADEEPPPGTEVVIEDTIATPTAPNAAGAEDKAFEEAFRNIEETLDPVEEPSEAPAVFEIPADSEFFTKPSETTEAFAETAENPPVAEASAAENTNSEASVPVSGTLFQSEPEKQAAGETIRQSGLAWSAGIVFFGSIVFMMIFGWFADLLLGSQPWGIVGGIVLGAIIGFIQFFRITSQIFKK